MQESRSFPTSMTRMMAMIEQYRCPQCQTVILTEQVDGFRRVYPPGVPANSEGDGRVMLRVRPGSLICHNPVHGDKPVTMRRERIDV